MRKTFVGHFRLVKLQPLHIRHLLQMNQSVHR